MGRHGRRAGTGRRTAALAAAAASAIAASLAAGQDGGRVRTPDLPDLPRPAQVVADPSSSVGGLQWSDVSRAELVADRGDLVFQVEMQRDLADGVFTRANVDFDCDGRRADVEVEAHAAAGSRYRPSAHVPRAGEAGPMALLRASWASVFQEEHRGFLSLPRIPMTHRGILDVPTVGGRRLRFRFPAVLLRDRGASGSTSPPAYRLDVTTGISEHPIAFDYDALDGGRPVVVDGWTDDWSGGPYAEDAPGELHESMRHLDIVAVWCEHGPEREFVRVDFERAGFGAASPGDDDVSVEDELVVVLEPRGGDYMEPVTVRVPADRQSGRTKRFEHASERASVEVSIPRNPKQTAFRVAAWTDAARNDVVEGGWRPLPAFGGRR